MTLIRVRRLDERLLVFRTSEPGPYWSGDPAPAGVPPEAAAQAVSGLLFAFDPQERHPFRVVTVELLTPRGLLAQWRRLLSPPVKRWLQPSFTLEEMESLAPRSLLSRVEAGMGNPREVPEWGELPSRSRLRILLPQEGLGVSTILRALRSSVVRHAPRWGGRYPLVWADDVPPSLGTHLYHFQERWREALRLPEEERRKAEEAARRFWRETLAPLRAETRASALLQEEERTEGEQGEEGEEEGFHHDLPADEGRRATSLVLWEATRPAQTEREATDLANRPGFYEYLCLLARRAYRFPTLPIQEALQDVEGRLADPQGRPPCRPDPLPIRSGALRLCQVLEGYLPRLITRIRVYGEPALPRERPLRLLQSFASGEWLHLGFEEELTVTLHRPRGLEITERGLILERAEGMSLRQGFWQVQYRRNLQGSRHSVVRDSGLGEPHALQAERAVALELESG